MTGFDNFLDVLTKYKSLILWVTTTSILLPLAADQVNLTPPWPKGIVLLTAIWQMLAIVVTFQFSHRLSRRSANRAIISAALLMVAFSVVYLGALSKLTFEGGAARERLVKGFACTEEALRLEKYSKQCPFLSDRLINSAESTEQLWTPESITSSRVLLLFLWLLTYIPIAICFALFTTFQSQQRTRVAVRPPTKP